MRAPALRWNHSQNFRANPRVSAAGIPAHVFSGRFEAADGIAAAGAGAPIAVVTAAEAVAAIAAVDEVDSNGGPAAVAAVISSIVAGVLVMAIPVTDIRAVLS